MWLTPGRPLSAAEADRYATHLSKTLPIQGSEKAVFVEQLRDFAMKDDGRPVYMVNLMRYHPKTLPGLPAGFIGTPAAANKNYEESVLPIALREGAYPIFIGNAYGRNVMGNDVSEDNWSRVILMRYPSRRAFLELLSDPKYQEFMPYKLLSLHLALVPVQEEALVPDLRVAGVIFAILIFLSLGWVRSARRLSAINAGSKS